MLSIPLPLVEREQIHLHRSIFDEVVVRIGNWKRNIALPTGLAKLEIDGAGYVEDRLNIRFAQDVTVPEPAPEALRANPWQALRARLGGKST